MTAPTTIVLTNFTTGARETVTVSHIVRRWPEGNGTAITYPDGLLVFYQETPEQIDALLGVTDALPAGHRIIEQADMLDGRVAQTVTRPDGREYQRIVSTEEAYGEA